MKIHESENLIVRVDIESLEWSRKRAGNSRSLTLCEKEPTNILFLRDCKIGSGHDCYLNGVNVLIDWKINKIIREQLLRYRFINVVSSQSLMYKCKELTGIEEVDDVPLGFAYWISFSTNYRQLKTILSQRQNHKREEWKEFCRMIQELPQ